MTIVLRRFAAALLLGLVVPPLGGCLTSTAPARPGPAPPVAAGSTEPLRFGELAIGSMRRGMEIGRYVWDIDCAPPYDEVYWTSGANMRRGSTFDERLEEALGAAGFDVVGRQGGPDAPDGNRARARFTVQGDLRDVRLELCHRTNWLTGSAKGVSGTGSARVDWTVYDARSGRLVHRVTTSGVSRQDHGVPQGDTLLIEEAVAAAAERLAADSGFRAVLARGAAARAALTRGPLAVQPPSTGGASSGGVPPLAPLGPRAALTLRTPAADGGAVDGGAADPAARAGAAQVRVGEGYGLVIGEVWGEVGGSGGRESLLLVPHSGAEATVAVRPARGVLLTGTVEGRDPASGLALVRVPARLTAVPVRDGAVAVSEPVSVAMRRGTESAAGIVGAVRTDPARGVDVIQADLGPSGVPAAAGDPLLDESGAVVGLALGPEGVSATAPPGLVGFLPVGPLLARIGVDVQADPRADPGANRRDSGRIPPRASRSATAGLRQADDQADGAARPGRRRAAGRDEELDGDDDPPT